jgi:Domain of unknown function (DUF6473)
MEDVAPTFRKRIFSASTHSVVSEFKPAFERAQASNNLYAANTLAMRAAESLFRGDAEQARLTAWKEFFSHLTKNYGAQYQCLDFEMADYHMAPLISGRRLLRGPHPSLPVLDSGDYVTILGAAQLFGRFQAIAPHERVAAELGVACLNHSIGGAGPESFLRRDIVDVANRGKAVVLQILSGRSIGCDEYPGARLTTRPGSERKVDRLKLLREIWQESRDEAARLISKWQIRYVDTMRQLLEQLEVPVVLVWVSDRAPEDWSVSSVEHAPDFGRFPQLVDRAMVDTVVGDCADLVLLTKDEGLPHGFSNRFTGQPCPVFRPDGTQVAENNYYPSPQASQEMSSAIATALAPILAKRRDSSE